MAEVFFRDGSPIGMLLGTIIVIIVLFAMFKK